MSAVGVGAREWRANIGPTQVAMAVAVFVGLFAASRYSYPLFHSIAESLTVIAAVSVFGVVWGARGYLDNAYLRLVGVAYVYVAAVDFLHMLSYKGMGVFTGFDPLDLPTQLWVAGRYLQASALLLAPVLFGRRVGIRIAASAYAVATAILLMSIFWWDVFPTALTTQGLTAFKVWSEYVVAALLVASMFLLRRHREQFDPDVYIQLQWAIAIFAASGLVFTMYMDPFGFSNLVGHYLRILAFALTYRAVFVTAFIRPQSVLYRRLQKTYEREHRIAETLQESMLMVPSEVEGLQIGHLYASGAGDAKVGGDFFEVFEVGDDRIVGLIGDVAGKGLGAAATTALAKNAIKSHTVDRSSPAEVLQMANDTVRSFSEPDTFLTVFYVNIDRTSGRMTYCSAGHPPPLVVRSDGEVLELPCPNHNTILGVFSGIVYEESSFLLDPGDTVVLYTDGVLEARRDGELMGGAGLLAVVTESAWAQPQALVTEIFDEVIRFSGGGMVDDIALLALKWTPSG